MHMDWKSWLWQAVIVLAVVIVVLAFLRVLDLRFRVQPVEFLARPFYPAPPQGSAGDTSAAPMMN